MKKKGVFDVFPVYDSAGKDESRFILTRLEIKISPDVLLALKADLRRAIENSDDFYSIRRLVFVYNNLDVRSDLQSDNDLSVF